MVVMPTPLQIWPILASRLLAHQEFSFQLFFSPKVGDTCIRWSCVLSVSGGSLARLNRIPESRQQYSSFLHMWMKLILNLGPRGCFPYCFWPTLSTKGQIHGFACSFFPLTKLTLDQGGSSWCREFVQRVVHICWIPTQLHCAGQGHGKGTGNR